jgi:hypothetical protein
MIFSELLLLGTVSKMPIALKSGQLEMGADVFGSKKARFENMTRTTYIIARC